MKNPQGHHTPDTHVQSNSYIIRGKKDRRVLEAFVNLGDIGLNKLEAFNIADTCLPSTVFHLERRFNLYFNRKEEEIENRFHGITVFKRYWLEGGELERARKLLEAAEKS